MKKSTAKPELLSPGRVLKLKAASLKDSLLVAIKRTCVIVPELKSAFDIGRCPSRAIHQNFVFITHAQLDHILSSMISPKDDVFSHGSKIVYIIQLFWFVQLQTLSSGYYYTLIWRLLSQGGLPMYVASRGLYNLKPPTVFVPPCIKEDVETLLDIHRTMGKVELNLDLVPLDVGETYGLRNDIVVRPFRTHHVIPGMPYQYFF
ncbi:Ribonuclease Z [Hibiscus syriacus]|uniref:Ribonuclease Z n=1 Tax=Hibiscus syriacus TaxID=106335 RepID=A0A6A3BBP7_HIBSY|nr:Ribonuclease Z [Hibiscus syriacus]